MRIEHHDRRVLGAIRLLDSSTGLPVQEPLRIEAPGVKLVRNRSGSYIIFSAPGFRAYQQSWLDPPEVAPVELELTISDPNRRYLSRRCLISLPRDLDPDHADQPDSIFQLIDVPLFPTPAARTGIGWAIVRASVVRQGGTQPIAGALIRVVRSSDSSHVASGLTDDRGEALVAVVGIPVTTWEENAGAILTSEIDVVLQVVVDPAARPIPNPDDLEARRNSLPSSTFDTRLASGQTIYPTLSVALP